MDLKQRFKSPITWFIILILSVMSMLNIMETREFRVNRPFKGHDPYSQWRSDAFDYTKLFDEETKKLYPEEYYARYLQTKTDEDLIIANEKENMKEINRLISFHHLLLAKEGAVRHDAIMNTVFKQKVINIWDEVSNGVPYEDINFGDVGIHREGVESNLLLAKYYHKLYVNDIEPFYFDDNTNIKYTYDYFFKILPKFIVVIGILLAYNSINKEKKTGSLKLIMTQSMSRWKYYIGKWISGVGHVLSVLLIPVIVISTILGFENGFMTITYPTMYLKGTMTSLKPIPNYFDNMQTLIADRHMRFLFSNFSYVAPSSKSDIGWYNMHKNTELISFYKYLLMVILLTILFIGFCVALIQLISAMIDKEIISLAVTSFIFVIGILISSPFKYEKHLNLSPFTMENASRIIIGSYNVTGLVSALILLGSTIVLLGIGCRYFKKKEI